MTATIVFDVPGQVGVLFDEAAGRPGWNRSGCSWRFDMNQAATVEAACALLARRYLP
ncbi:MAG: hypothetical protein HY830_15285 [Actinobacteria bacterium]|nr:hypothetical protein [Actinomycetota bacterium]